MKEFSRQQKMASAVQLLPLACLLTAFLGPATALDTVTLPPVGSSADARLLFKFIIISPDSCTSTSGGTGICYSRQDCSSLSGTSDGNCAKGLGVCCTFTRTCGEQTQFQSTMFTNPLYPAPVGVPGPCVLTVFPMNNNVCQVRLDMVDFKLDQPDKLNGVCKTDFMTVTGGSSAVPMICGDNKGQHMYVDVEPNSTGSLKINIDSSIVGALWNIIVTQIECTSTSRAPDGCLQYFTGTSGVVRSFNYVTASSPLPTNPPTRQLANQNYGVCIQSQSGYCSVTWEKPIGEGEYFFSMTEDATSIMPGLPGVSLQGDVCTTDYVIIPGGEFDRFCGNGFPTEVQSSVTPYVMYVVTNDVETAPDAANQGFSLRYRAKPCP